MRIYVQCLYIDLSLYGCKGKHAAETQHCNELLDGTLAEATDNGGRSPETTGSY
jgi:hypothetical protein